jgi:hypothetical protein
MPTPLKSTERAAWFARFRRCRNGCGLDVVAVCEIMRTGTARPALQCPRCLAVTAYVPRRLMRCDVESLPLKMTEPAPDSRQQNLFD